MGPVVVAVDWSWSLMMMVLRLMVNISVLTGECALNGSKVLSFFVLDFRSVDWDAVDWCWGITID